jgi:UDP-N-acetylmuramate dehydrogenase
MEIQEGVTLAPLTTFGIGGPAAYFARAQSIADLHAALDFAKEKSLKTFILGGGSNVLLPDHGFKGVVIKVELPGFTSITEDEGELLVVGGGESWDGVVAHTVEKGWWGVENLSGIPGTVGGAVVQNIGAYGAALSQTLEWVEMLDTTESRTKTLTNEQCRFGYRDSIFKQEPGRYIALTVALRLSHDARPNLTYKDLAEYFKERAPTLKEIRTAVLEIRQKKFPNLTVEGSAGSFFKNPIVSGDEAKKLEEKYPGMPVFSLPESHEIKIPLGWILDHVLHLRGYTEGPVRSYEHQALVVVAKRGAQSKQVKDFVTDVQKKVFDACAIRIEPEVFILD